MMMGACGKAYSPHRRWEADRERDKMGPGKDTVLKNMFPVTYFLQPVSFSYTLQNLPKYHHYLGPRFQHMRPWGNISYLKHNIPLLTHKVSCQSHNLMQYEFSPSLKVLKI
jgi:hypothetical protein